MGYKFGDTSGFPLLVSVRSGARDSMPGMMDTILNLGLNDKTVLALSRKTGNERFAWDCYRRFVQMYGDVVLGVQKLPARTTTRSSPSSASLKAERHGLREIEDTKLRPTTSRSLSSRFRALIAKRTGSEFPQDPAKQLLGRNRRRLRLLDE